MIRSYKSHRLLRDQQSQHINQPPWYERVWHDSEQSTSCSWLCARWLT